MTLHAVQLLSQVACRYSSLISHCTPPLVSTYFTPSVNSPIWLMALDFTWLSLALRQVRQVRQVRHETLTGYLTGLDWAAVRQAPIVKSRGSVKAVLRAYFQICTNRWAQTIYSLQQLTSELATRTIIAICSSCLRHGSRSIFSGS